MARIQTVKPKPNGNGHDAGVVLAGKVVLDLGPQRAALKAELNRLREEAARLSRLEAASQEAEERSWQSAVPISEAREELDAAKTQESAYKANYFIEHHKVPDAPSPRLTAALAALETAEKQNEEVWGVRTTLEVARKDCEAQIERIRKDVNARIGDLIVASPAWKALHRAQHEGWCQVRAARKTLAMLSKYVLRHNDSLKWQTTEHLDWETNGVETPVEPFATFKEFVTNLVDDPDLPVPDVG